MFVQEDSEELCVKNFELLVFLRLALKMLLLELVLSLVAFFVAVTGVGSGGVDAVAVEGCCSWVYQCGNLVRMCKRCARQLTLLLYCCEQYTHITVIMQNTG